MNGNPRWSTRARMLARHQIPLRHGSGQASRSRGVRRAGVVAARDDGCRRSAADGADNRGMASGP